MRGSAGAVVVAAALPAVTTVAAGAVSRQAFEEAADRLPFRSLQRAGVGRRQGLQEQAPVFAQLRVQGAAAEAPKLTIESGATLRILRPVRFVQPDEDISLTIMNKRPGLGEVRLQALPPVAGPAALAAHP